MTKLIINADDFGYSKGINYGIMESHLNGAVTSTTMMANMPGLKHALRLMDELPDLGIGVHLSLTMGRPVIDRVDQLVDEKGVFKSRKYYHTHTADLDQLYEEWKAQIEKLLRLGVRLTHIDSHHYMHALKEHLAVTERLSEEYHLPVRTYQDARKRAERPSNFPAEDFWNLFNYPPMKDMTHPYKAVEEQLMSILIQDAQHYRQYGLVEASCHPGYIDTEVYYQSSFHLPRMREVKILTSGSFKELLDRYGYELCHYGHIS
ncbi:carbohydrate deacetylase [Atopococcus tabaci]|uniref:carbohydrate deacetylase n=1 Tax=Atopococcus tabaci TaxID=269774 RepID=UPI00041E55F8|nr:carbohydrate deacetylase [Atopococcus tabaci]